MDQSYWVSLEFSFMLPVLPTRMSRFFTQQAPKTQLYTNDYRAEFQFTEHEQVYLIQLGILVEAARPYVTVAAQDNSGLVSILKRLKKGNEVFNWLICLVLQNEIIFASLRNSGKVAVMASEEDDAPIWINDDGPFVVVTDPLDGSRNIDASIPTGTSFGVYKRLVELDHLPQDEKAMLNSLQSGAKLVAAGYVLYSLAIILCSTFGSGTHAFTLDYSTGDFILTHPGIKINPRGNFPGFRFLYHFHGTIGDFCHNVMVLLSTNWGGKSDRRANALCI
ncbi:fructose-1,6-bisphosphatase, chloroplastic-like [Ricinus communis]|uniref:fructose-1,6-bisphosphatase, chloroplastic-like n=1 Tax=Ricinus communis TaxID=3988 RepID=UPI00201ADDEF|nr:fructose-1,6-bisphosphatase, chloroplastic-like [Ricinus communis]